MTREENEKRLERLKGIVGNLPQKPGCYQYHDGDGTVIYVGKAKNLRNRVGSYFHKEVDRYKTKVLVSKIMDITYTVVNTEEDALLLENSLIKKHQPKYNILLKDGKTYPWICVTKETFPRIFKTRTVNRKTGTYYGPYSNIGTMQAILELIRKLYRPRTCRFPMTLEGVGQGKYRTCLEYHMHNCGAPCVGKQSQGEYMEAIAQAREILKGNTRQLSRAFHDKMVESSGRMQFEMAEEMKRKYLLLEGFRSRSEVVSNTIDNVDVFTLDDSGGTAYMNYMHVTNGSINQARTYELKKRLDETAEEILRIGIVRVREDVGSDSPEIIVPMELDMVLEGVTLAVPRRGDRKKLLDLSEMNCRQYRLDRLKQAEKLNPEQRSVRLMKEIQEAMGLKRMPYRIEMFDNSNISGTDPVASCVVFEGMRPAKKEYRKYNIRTVAGPDDYASMREVIHRRYSRLIEEGSPLPDLVITDGGKGQMGSVRKAIVDELGLDIPIAGLAKDDRHRTSELLFGFPPKVIGMRPDSELFRLLTHMQDEAHRFAIAFHRDKRSKRALHSELDDIRGIGPKSKEALLRELKTVRRIREADLDTLAGILGKGKGKIVHDHFTNMDKRDEGGDSTR